MINLREKKLKNIKQKNRECFVFYNKFLLFFTVYSFIVSSINQKKKRFKQC